MASAKEGDSRAADIIKNWIRNRYTIEFLGTWEVIHNPDFKVVEFDHFRKTPLTIAPRNRVHRALFGKADRSNALLPTSIPPLQTGAPPTDTHTRG